MGDITIILIGLAIGNLIFKYFGNDSVLSAQENAELENLCAKFEQDDTPPEEVVDGLANYLARLYNNNPSEEQLEEMRGVIVDEFIKQYEEQQ